MHKVKLVASRFLIPLELYLGATSVAWAFAGGFGKGMLRQVLISNGHPYFDEVWFVSLLLIGISQIVAGAVEWRYGRYWSLTSVWRSARVRWVVAFMAVMIWLCVAKMLWDTGPLNLTLGLVLMAPITIAAQWWVFWENYRVRLAADESIPTSTIIFKR